MTTFEPRLIPVSNESHRETGSSQSETVPLNLTLAKNSDRHSEDCDSCTTPRVGYGATGRVSSFSLNGRRRILRAGGAIDKTTDSPSESIFLTGTLPGSTEEAKRAIAEWSSYAVNLVQSWLGKRIPNKLLIYSWEFQRRGALHLHVVVVCKDSTIAQEIISGWKAQWTRVIDDISLKSGVDCWRKNRSFSYADDNKDSLQTDAKECRASVAAYLSKYLSKANMSPDVNYVQQYSPSRFWGVSRPLCALLDSLTEVFEIDIQRSDELQTAYEDILSVLQSESGSVYSWRAKVGRAVASVAYLPLQIVEITWKQILNLAQGFAGSWFLDLEHVRDSSRVLSRISTKVASSLIHLLQPSHKQAQSALIYQQLCTAQPRLKYTELYDPMDDSEMLLDLLSKRKTANMNYSIESCYQVLRATMRRCKHEWERKREVQRETDQESRQDAENSATGARIGIETGSNDPLDGPTSAMPVPPNWVQLYLPGCEIEKNVQISASRY